MKSLQLARTFASMARMVSNVHWILGIMVKLLGSYRLIQSFVSEMSGWLQRINGTETGDESVRGSGEGTRGSSERSAGQRGTCSAKASASARST